MVEKSLYSNYFARRAISYALCATLALCPSGAFADSAEQAPRQELIVASVAYNFARFIQWRAPDAGEAQANLVFCILDAGASPAWRQLEGKAVGDRKIQLEYLGKNAPSGHNCNLLYVNEDSLGALSLGELAESGVVSISDARHFVKKGGAIQLLISDKGATFDINERSLNRAGARISSKLMRVGMRVSLSGE